MEKVKINKILKNKNFRLIAGGQLISTYGDSIYLATILWIAAELTNSTFQVSLISIFDTLPAIVLGLLAGVIVDRFPKLKIMIISDYVRALLILLVFILFGSRLLNIWLILLFTFIIAFFQGLYNPAQFAVIPQILKKEEIQHANSFTTFLQNITTIFGSSSSGYIYNYLGAPISFIIDVISFIISGTCTIFVHPAKREHILRTENESSIISEAILGLRYLFSRPVLVSCMSVAITLNMISGALVILPLYIKNVLSLDITIFGLTEAAGAVGMILGSMILMRLKIQNSLKGLFFAGLFQGFCFVIIAIFPSVMILIIFRAFLGLFNSIVNILFITLFHNSIDENYLGRVFSISFMISTLTLPIIAVACGFFSESLGINTTWTIFGLLGLAFLLLNLFITSKKNLFNISQKEGQYYENY